MTRLTLFNLPLAEKPVQLGGEVFVAVEAALGDEAQQRRDFGEVGGGGGDEVLEVDAVLQPFVGFRQQLHRDEVRDAGGGEDRAFEDVGGLSGLNRFGLDARRGEEQVD